MKTFIYKLIFFLLLAITCSDAAAQTATFSTAKKPPAVSNSQSTPHQDDPNKIYAACMPPNSTDTLWIKVQGNTCLGNMNPIFPSVSPAVIGSVSITPCPVFYYTGAGPLPTPTTTYYYPYIVNTSGATAPNFYTFFFALNGNNDSTYCRDTVVQHLYISSTPCAINQDTVLDLNTCQHCITTTANPAWLNSNYCSLAISNITTVVNCGQACLTANLAGDTTHLNYSWTLGNGTSSTNANPCVTYSNAGTFPITLTVNSLDSCGNTCAANATSAVTIATAPINTNFCYTVTASTKSITLNNVTVTGCTGIKTYKWHIKNAAGTLIYTSPTVLTNPNISYTFPTSGDYQVCLVTKCVNGTDTCCMECCKNINIPVPCSAINPLFTYTTAASGNNVTFNSPTASAVGISYSWTINGVLQTSPTPKTPVFSLSSGTYTVCHTITAITGANGEMCRKQFCKTITIAANTGCTANANFKHLNCGNNTLTFTNTSTGASTYLWDFGDGTSATIASPVHTFPTTGDYNVILTINPGTLCSSKTQIKVKVTPNVCTPQNCQ